MMHFPLPSCQSGLSITYTNTNSHIHTPTGKSAYTCPQRTRMLTQTDTHAHTHILLPLVFNAGTGADTSRYPGAADPLLCSTTLLYFGRQAATLLRQKKGKFFCPDSQAVLTLKMKSCSSYFIFSSKQCKSDQYI